MQIIGHRGAAGLAPENTLLSFRRAIELGCRAVEMDVHLTKDGELVVIHDAKVDRVTNGRGHVKRMTLAHLQSLRCTMGQHPPTLQQVIDLCKGRAKMFIELKAQGTAEAVVDLIAKNRLESEVVILSFKIRLLKKIKRLNPRIRVNYLFYRRPIRLWGLVSKVPLDYIGPRFHGIGTRLVKRAHKLKCKVYAYDVMDMSTGAKMRTLKVDAVCTDYPIMFLPPAHHR